jgi:hypothetical protein
MGGAKRYPSLQFAKEMGFAKGSTHPTRWDYPQKAGREAILGRGSSEGSPRLKISDKPEIAYG